MAQAPESIEQIAQRIAVEQDTDILFYTGSIHRPDDTLLIRKCVQRRRRTNVTLVMLSTGGDADAAYRIARCLQSKYKKFTFYVAGYCKSAGTLVALGAHELVFSDFGELGPLDVQMSKKDELFEVESGLTVMDAITTLNEKAYAAFEDFFLRTKAGGAGSITMHSAAEFATQLTTGLFSQLYAQIDPMHVGEAGRALEIADYYGSRLLAASGNCNQSALTWLNTQYPHHGFVIDRDEASTLFENVREPTPSEYMLAESLTSKSRFPERTRGAKIEFLNDELPATPQNEEGANNDNHDAEVAEQQSSGHGQEPRERVEGGPEEVQRHQPKLAAVGEEAGSG